MKTNIEQEGTEVDPKGRDVTPENESVRGGMSGYETEESRDTSSRQASGETDVVSSADPAAGEEERKNLTKSEDVTSGAQTEGDEQSPQDSSPSEARACNDALDAQLATEPVESVEEREEKQDVDREEARSVSTPSSSVPCSDSSSHATEAPETAGHPSGDDLINRDNVSRDKSYESEQTDPCEQTCVIPNDPGDLPHDTTVEGENTADDTAVLAPEKREEDQTILPGDGPECSEASRETEDESGERNGLELPTAETSSSSTSCSEHSNNPADSCSLPATDSNSSGGGKGYREEDMREVISSLDRDSLESMVRRIQKSVVCLVAEEKHIKQQQILLLQERRELDEQVAVASRELQEYRSKLSTAHPDRSSTLGLTNKAPFSLSSSSSSWMKPADHGTHTSTCLPPQSLSAPCIQASLMVKEDPGLREGARMPHTEEEEVTSVDRQKDKSNLDQLDSNRKQEKENIQSNQSMGENLDILENLIVKYGPAAVKTVETAANKMKTGISVLRHELAVMQRHNRAIERHRQLERRAKLRFMCEERLELTHRQRLLQHLGASLDPANPGQQLSPGGSHLLNQMPHGAVMVMPGSVCTPEHSASPSSLGESEGHKASSSSTEAKHTPGETSLNSTADGSASLQASSDVTQGEEVLPSSTKPSAAPPPLLSVQSTSIGTTLSPVISPSGTPQGGVYPVCSPTSEAKLMRRGMHLQQKQVLPNTLSLSPQSGHPLSSIPASSSTRLRASGGGSVHTPEYPFNGTACVRVGPSRPRGGSAAVVLGTRRERLQSAVKSLSSATPGASLENLSKGVATAVGTAKSNLTRWLFGGEGEQSPLRSVAPLPFAGGGSPGEDRRRPFTSGLTEEISASVDPNSCLLQPDKIDILGALSSSAGGGSCGSLGIPVEDEESRKRSSREPHPSQVFDLATPTSDHCPTSAHQITSPSHDEAAHEGEESGSAAPATRKISGDGLSSEVPLHHTPDGDGLQGQEDGQADGEELVCVIEGVVNVELGSEDLHSIKIVVSATEQCSTAAESWVRENWGLLSQAHKSEERCHADDPTSESTATNGHDEKEKAICISQEKATELLSDYLARVEAESQELPVKVDFKWNALVAGEL
ncbi:glutamic acid-rich protein [Cystoisospora suis]|uniref:Glutamic acid-rich protein n=1 Tax=Cystoisospora suis TaxID=483139 RepID=A0A2C6KT61_9APIC|nr:glutamic acid-rich protein [Cystoisospora suis]